VALRFYRDDRVSRFGSPCRFRVPVAPALAAENLFLRKQMALFQERKIKARMADDTGLHISTM
jgi:hypothetical protein